MNLDQVLAIFDGHRAAPSGFDTLRTLVERLSPADLGALQPRAWAMRHGMGAADGVRGLAFLIADHPRARFSPQAFAAGLDYLLGWLGSVDATRPTPVRLQGMMPVQSDRPPLARAIWTLIRGLESDPPVSSHEALRQVQAHVEVSARHDLSGYVVARLVGDADRAQSLREKLMTRVEGDLAARQWIFLFNQPPLRLRDFQVADMEENPEARRAALTRVFDGLPGYDAFAQEIFAAALARLSAIAARQTAYRADGAFLVQDCEVIEQAAAYGLSRQAPWCLDRLAEIWRMAAFAPDPQAKTMPSQSLTLRLAHATVDHPGPQSLRALDEVSAICRHAGLAKKLERARKSARTALAAHPERLLDLSEPLEKPLLKPFAAAVEGLLAQPDPMPAPLWLDRFGPGRKEGWALARSLIWEITPTEGASLTGLPLKSGGWSLLGDQQRPFDATDRIRLWHPVDAPDNLSRAWRGRLEQGDVRQPFLQAGREIYRPDPSEVFGRITELFARRKVSALQMIGLARVSGWRSGIECELFLSLAGVDFVFKAGVPTYPGADAHGETEGFHLIGPQGMLSAVPPRTLSEALRKLDLIVTIGERGRA